MIHTWALIIGGIVDNIIVADDQFINDNSDNFDFAVIVPDSTPNAGPGSYYHQEDGTYSLPTISHINPPFAGYTTNVIRGIASTFPTFDCADSGYRVSQAGTNTSVGCLTFETAWLKNELTIICIDNGTGTLSSTDGSTIFFGQFEISFADGKNILTHLELLNL